MANRSELKIAQPNQDSLSEQDPVSQAVSMSTMKKRRVTLKDVAQALGVSAATVSNAFNRPDQLSEQLREQILTKSQSMEYFGPNATAKALRTGESGIVGVLLADRLTYNFNIPRGILHP